jgi:pyruvate/2-oxoacid:ferredoxin oxidoreductase beta subunit
MRLGLIKGLSLVLFLSACVTKQEYFTKQQLEHKSDSLTEIRFKELREQAAEDLDRRISIEVKPKVDSILDKTDLKPVVVLEPVVTRNTSQEHTADTLR